MTVPYAAKATSNLTVYPVPVHPLEKTDIEPSDKKHATPRVNKKANQREGEGITTK